MLYLCKIVREKCKASFRTKFNDDGTKVYNVANYGCKKYDLFYVHRGGEYHDITFQAMENIRPLITSERMIKALRLLNDNNITRVVKVLHIENYVISHGVNIIYNVLYYWLKKNALNVPDEIDNKRINLDESTEEEINNFAITVRHHSITVPIKIVNVGFNNAGVPVVPTSYLNKIYANGDELHKAIDELEWRQGKPPVNYCCIYSLTKKDTNTWSKEVNNINDFAEYYVIVEVEKNIKSSINIAKDISSKYIDDWKKKGYSFLSYQSQNTTLIIVAQLDKIIKETEYIKNENVGVLVSRLQKSIRRGRNCNSILLDSIDKLNSAPIYNLPSLQFIKVSGTRQLVWRLFITCIEDVQPYICNSEYLSLQDLLCLSILTNADPNIQFNDDILNIIKKTATSIQFMDHSNDNWSWKKHKMSNIPQTFNDNPITNNDKVQNTIYFALQTMPMMKGDMQLLNISWDMLFFYKLKELEPINTVNIIRYSANDLIIESCLLASNDMHCFPSIILYLQSSLPFLPANNKTDTTKGISNFIWDNSSRLNVRNPTITAKKDKKITEVLQELYYIQQFLIEEPQFDPIIITSDEIKNTHFQKSFNISEGVSRLAFQLIFGRKVHLPRKKNNNACDVIIAGTKEKPCKVKKYSEKCIYIEGQERYDAELRYVQCMNTPQTIKLMDAPIGYKWIWDNSNVKIKAELLSSDPEKMTNVIRFYVNDIPTEPFDGSPFIVPVNNSDIVSLPDNVKQLVEHALYINKSEYGEWQLNNIMNRTNNHTKIFNWYDVAIKSKIPQDVWREVLVKVSNEEIQIGPVDRGGEKLTHSINGLYEGTIMRVINMLCMLYPNVIRSTSNLKYLVKYNSSYVHMVDTIKKLAITNYDKKQVNIGKINKAGIITNLWEHQKNTSECISREMIFNKRKGFGDASEVGSGKTLTALATITKLINHNIENKITSHAGSLVLLPNEKLYKTWEDEIKKHCKNVNYIIQTSKGTLEKYNVSNNKMDNNDIDINSIVITTMGRCRDKPISNNWLVVVIDECLTVQNKQAQQTISAWKQVLCSQYGVIMLSATFFRTRFEKLYYMLKILQTGLPENKEYLDTILAESIVCYLSKNNRKWIVNFNRNKLPTNEREQYEIIKRKNITSDKMYTELSKIIHSNNYVQYFKKVINQLDSKKEINHKCLIYAKSKEEVEEIANSIENVGIYPDIYKKHVVISYNDGVYGLNNLIEFNTIVTRIPYPDLLPQMKGRLDRPNQKSNMLYLEYILLADTIEEGHLLRLELNNNFYRNYIMPLSELYDIAIKY